MTKLARAPSIKLSCHQNLALHCQCSRHRIYIPRQCSLKVFTRPQDTSIFLGLTRLRVCHSKGTPKSKLLTLDPHTTAFMSTQTWQCTNWFLIAGNLRNSGRYVNSDLLILTRREPEKKWWPEAQICLTGWPHSVCTLSGSSVSCWCPWPNFPHLPSPQVYISPLRASKAACPRPTATYKISSALNTESSGSKKVESNMRSKLANLFEPC